MRHQERKIWIVTAENLQKPLDLSWKRLKTGSAAAVYIRWEQMRLPANFLLFVH